MKTVNSQGNDFIFSAEKKKKNGYAILKTNLRQKIQFHRLYCTKKSSRQVKNITINMAYIGLTYNQY